MSAFVREAVLVRDSFFFACIAKGARPGRAIQRRYVKKIVFSEGGVRFYAGRVIKRSFVRQVGMQVWAAERMV